MSKLFQSKGRYGFILLWMITALFIQRGDIMAGITGKIAGRVIDAQTREPLPSASIIISGTTMGAASDIDGYYYIINVPPGTYSLAATMVGYQKVEISEVRVTIDHTTNVDFSLNTADVEMGEVVIVAPREVIKKDVASSIIVANAEQITSIPFVNDVTSYVNLQAGVINDNVRGGGLDQRGFMVDGLISVDNRTNQPLVLTNMSTVQELQLVKGGFNAEYGNIRSGLVNIVTKDPNPNKINVYMDIRFTPARQKHDGASIYSPDNYYNRPFMDPGVAFVGTASGSWDEATRASNLTFVGWNQWVKDNPQYGFTPEQAQQYFMWQRALEGSGALGQKEGSYGDKPDYRGDISISGGVPFIGEYLGNLSFLASFAGDVQQFRYPTALDYYSTNTSSLKLVSRISPSMKLGLLASYNERRTVTNNTAANRDDAFFTSGGNSFESYIAWWPEGFVPMTIYNSTVGLSFDHVISNSTFYNVRISSVNITQSAREWGPESFRDTSTIAYIGPYPVSELPYGWQLRNSKGELQPIKDAGGSIYSTDAGGTRNNSYSRTLNVKFDLTSQLDRYNQIKTGFEFNYDDVMTDYARVRYMAPHESFQTKWNRFPIRFGAYIQDKLEFEGLIANIGVRFDYNEPNGEWFDLEDPYSKYFSKPYKDRIDEAPTKTAKGHLKISPRLGVSHPISENVKLFFNYGHFYSMPQTSNMYRIDWGIGVTGVNNLGNPFLDMPRTIAYELGVDWDIANEVLVHLATYYRNIDAQINSIRYTNYTNSVNYETYNNSNYQDVRGFELTVEKNYGWITGLLTYTYEVSQKGNSGRNRYYQDPSKQENDMFEDPNVDRAEIRPWVRATMQIRSPRDLGPEISGFNPLGDWVIAPRFEWRAGSYIDHNPENVLGDGIKRNVQWAPSWSLDLRISKRFTIAKIGFDIYADINNLLYNKIISSSSSNPAFSSSTDREEYYKSLHLPLYADSRFDKIRDEAKGFYIAGDDKPGDIKSDDKPYINMPDIDFLTFTDRPYVTFGLRVNL